MQFGPFDGHGKTINEEQYYDESSSSAVGSLPAASTDTGESSVCGRATPESSISSQGLTEIEVGGTTNSEPASPPNSSSHNKLQVTTTTPHLPKVPTVSSHIDEIVEWALFPPTELIPPSIGHSIDDIVNWALFPPTELMLPSSPPASISNRSSLSSPGTPEAIDFLFTSELP